MNKSAIIIGVITLVLFGACRDYESVAYTQTVEVEKYDGTFLEYLSDEARHLFNQKYDSMLVIINAIPGLKEQLTILIISSNDCSRSLAVVSSPVNK